MRIIGNLIHNEYRLSFFRHEGKISIKFEKDGLTEFIIKWREGAVSDNFNELKTSLDTSFWKLVDDTFMAMGLIKKHLSSGMNEQGTDQLPDII